MLSLRLRAVLATLQRTKVLVWGKSNVIVSDDEFQYCKFVRLRYYSQFGVHQVVKSEEDTIGFSYIKP